MHGPAALQRGKPAPISQGKYPAQAIDFGRTGAPQRRQQWND
jgi:hypothetical protein